MVRARFALLLLVLFGGCQCKRSAPASEPLTLEYFVEHRASATENEHAIAELLEQRLSFTPDVDSFETVSDESGVRVRVRFMATIHEQDASRVIPLALQTERQRLPREVTGAVPEQRSAVEYVVSSGTLTLTDLRSLHDSVIAPALGTVASVQGVSACGGRQSVQVELDPTRVAALGLTVAEVADQLPLSRVERDALSRMRLGDGGATAADLATVEVRPDDDCLAWENGNATVVGKAHASRAMLSKVSADVTRKLASLQLPPGVTVKVRPPPSIWLEGFSTPDQVRLADSPSVIELSGPVSSAKGALWRAVRRYDSLSNRGIPGIRDITEVGGGKRIVADVCGTDFGQLSAEAQRVIDALGPPAVSSWVEVERLEPRVDPAAARELGVSEQTVLATYELATSGRRAPVRVTIAGRGTPELVGKFTVRGANGQVPLSSVLKLRAVREPLQILHVNRSRCVRVTAIAGNDGTTSARLTALSALKFPAAVTMRSALELR